MKLKIIKSFLIFCVTSILNNLKVTGLDIRSLRQNRTQNFNPEYKIVGGWMSTILKHPYIVSLQKSTNLARTFCGGTILNEKWVLTAAHCLVYRRFNTYDVYHPRNLVIVGGFTNLRNLNRVEYIYRIQSIYHHPKYNLKYFYNDIGLIQIKNKFNLWRSPRESVVRLMDSKFLHGQELEHVITNCKALGWGARETKGRFSDILMEVTLPIIPLDRCKRAYSNGKLIRPTNVCTYDYKNLADACQGDSGGPLVCQAPGDLTVQVGITSWGRGCGLWNSPGVWTRVDRYTGWIAKIIQDHLEGQPFLKSSSKSHRNLKILKYFIVSRIFGVLK